MEIPGTGRQCAALIRPYKRKDGLLKRNAAAAVELQGAGGGVAGAAAGLGHGHHGGRRHSAAGDRPAPGADALPAGTDRLHLAVGNHDRQPHLRAPHRPLRLPDLLPPLSGHHPCGVADGSLRAVMGLADGVALRHGIRRGRRVLPRLRLYLRADARKVAAADGGRGQGDVGARGDTLRARMLRVAEDSPASARVAVALPDGIGDDAADGASADTGPREPRLADEPRTRGRGREGRQGHTRPRRRDPRTCRGAPRCVSPRDTRRHRPENNAGDLLRTAVGLRGTGRIRHRGLPAGALHGPGPGKRAAGTRRHRAAGTAHRALGGGYHAHQLLHAAGIRAGSTADATYVPRADA